MTTSTSDHDRWLRLTLLGDQQAAASLLTLARRRGDPLLGLIARAVCEPVDWFKVCAVLDTLPVEALTPQVATHLRARSHPSRQVAVYQGTHTLIAALAAGQQPATLRLITSLLLWSPMMDAETWLRLYASPLDSLTSLSLVGAASELSLALLDPVASPWVARLRSLCVRVEVRSPRPVATRSMIDRVTAVSSETPPVEEREDDLNALLVRLSRCPTMALTALDLKGALRVDTVRAFTHAPWAGQLVSLRLSDEGLSSAAVRALADAPLAALRTLRVITEQPLQVVDLVALARAPSFLNLRALWLPAEGVMAAAQEVIAQADLDAALRAVALLSCAPADLRAHRLSLRALMSTPDPALRAIGRLLRPRLAALAEEISEALPAAPRHAADATPLHSGLACALTGVSAALFAAAPRPPLVSEQAALAAMMTAYARAVMFFGTSHEAVMLRCAPHITEGPILGALIASLLSDTRTHSCALSLMLKARAPARDPYTRAIQQQVALTIASQRAVRAQRAVISAFGSSDHVQALRASLTPWLWAALRDLSAPGPGAAALPESTGRH
jgi:hypothetical protein